ncbi:hypothetical protein LD85_1014 [Saccharolobus islandicus L.D.8.5]|uniref:Uncharacterized protein n=1 Tax=Saccharolobus islandicus (strain L.D.8.5 / Lassen \|nr:hypothetical protein LD85_1014 [Sulfolobus islandicus L.D.8.5]
MIKVHIFFFLLISSITGLDSSINVWKASRLEIESILTALLISAPLIFS